MTRKNWGALLVMLLVGGIIFMYSLREVNLQQLWANLLELNWGWLLVAIACMALYLILEGIVVKLFMNQRYPSYSWGNALRLPLIEQLFNGITPFSTGGQPAQIIAMLKAGVDGGRASSMLLMKFVVFQTMIVINFCLSMMIGFHLIATELQALTMFVIIGFLIHFVVITSLLMIMYWYQLTKRLVIGVIWPLHWFLSAQRYQTLQTTLVEKIDIFHQESLGMRRNPRLLVKVSLVTMGQLFFYYAIPYYLLLALGVTNLNFWMIMSLHIIIFMVTSVFPIPGGAGGAEYGFLVLFGHYVTNHSKLVLAMLLWRLLTYYGGIFVGMVATVIKPDKVSETD